MGYQNLPLMFCLIFEKLCLIVNVLSMCYFKNFWGKPRNAKGDNASQHCEILLLDACNKLSDSSYLSIRTMTADFHDVTR